MLRIIEAGDLPDAGDRHGGKGDDNAAAGGTAAGADNDTTANTETGDGDAAERLEQRGGGGYRAGGAAEVEKAHCRLGAFGCGVTLITGQQDDTGGGLQEGVTADLIERNDGEAGFGESVEAGAVVGHHHFAGEVLRELKAVLNGEIVCIVDEQLGDVGTGGGILNGGEVEGGVNGGAVVGKDAAALVGLQVELLADGGEALGGDVGRQRERGVGGVLLGENSQGFGFEETETDHELRTVGSDGEHRGEIADNAAAQDAAGGGFIDKYDAVLGLVGVEADDFGAIAGGEQLAAVGEEGATAGGGQSGGKRRRRGNGDGGEALAVGDGGVENEQGVQEITCAGTDSGNQDAAVGPDGDAFRASREADLPDDGRGGRTGIDDIDRSGVVAGDVEEVAIGGESGGERIGVCGDGGDDPALSSGENVDPVHGQRADEIEKISIVVEDEIARAAGHIDHRSEGGRGSNPQPHGNKNT